MEEERAAEGAGSWAAPARFAAWSGRELVPDLRLLGKWLGAAGFGLGQAYVRLFAVEDGAGRPM